MSQLEIITHRPEETQKLGTRLGELVQPGDNFLLVGGLGAGKTCLTQGIAWGLDIEEYAASPSFVVVRELKGRLPLYHIDLYRLENLEEIAELGLDDYLYGSGVCVVEWAEKGLSLLPPEHLLIEIDYLADTERRLKLKPRGQRYRNIVAEL
ncbi:MAG TPA: tRNA (adenosine(37)-N6)-threonylcarbamoyltransferase complex ATPase subunit type 1 TsaE [Dehalococcoidia bacterium]|nr:tRNA (adenosine(37)-N6)-threonylcarbamoyltransferase complex ATPase subunit type 1 TsaE [Dehalococcoidia bacterium]